MSSWMIGRNRRVPSGWATLATVATCLLAGCRSQVNTPRQAESWFEVVTATSGIRFRHERGPARYWLPEIMGGGAAWLDYDADGDLDLYFVQSGDLNLPAGARAPSNQLYENLGNGSFRDVTQRAGVGDMGYGMGVAIGDFDANGLPDIYVTNVGPNVLYQNLGDGTFRDVTAAAGVGDAGWGTSAVFVDYDQDGHTDLFVTNYIRWAADRETECRTADNQPDYCSPNVYGAPAADTLYRNLGDGTFRDVSQQVGINAAFGNGLGVVAADFNSDQRIDFYVANDGNPNQLWLQTGDQQFTDQALGQGCAVNRMGAAEAGMGVAVVDVENDGDLDLFMTHLGNESNTLYLSDGARFDDRTAAIGLGGPSVNFTGFGLGFADFDNDGHVDVYVANGRVGRGLPLDARQADPYAEPNQVFRGSLAGRYHEVLPRGGTSEPLVENSRAALFGDVDNDGDIDIVVVNNGQSPTVLRNQIGAKNHWLRIQLRDKFGNDACTARVRIEAAGRSQWRLVSRAYSYLASNEPHAHFGLGDVSQIDEVTVYWPSGEVETFGPHAANSQVLLQQEHGKLPQAQRASDELPRNAPGNGG